MGFFEKGSNSFVFLVKTAFAIFGELFIDIGQLLLKPSGHPDCYFFSSIARTNLEVDLVQRGGSLVLETRGASALPSFSTQTSNTNKPKFCFGKDLVILLCKKQEGA